MVYELSYMYRIPDSGKTYNVEWKAGTVPETAAMVTSVAAQTEYGYTSGSFEKVTRKITVPSDGDWYLGLHLTELPTRVLSISMSSRCRKESAHQCRKLRR